MRVDDVTRPEIPDANSYWGKLTSNPEEELFLEGPHGRGFELGRAFRIFRELIHGFRSLHFAGPCVTVFGSARFRPAHPYYALTCELGAKLGWRNFTVMTGGGPGCSADQVLVTVAAVKSPRIQKLSPAVSSAAGQERLR